MKTLSGFKLIHGVIIAIAVAVAGCEGVLAGQIQRLYAYPSAYVSSFFLGVTPLLTQDNEVLIPMPRQTINVTSTCSAFGFFCLLCAVLLINLPTSLPKKYMVMGSVLVLPAAYVITILANAGRIIGAYYAHHLGRLFLPHNFQAALHQGVGIAVFLGTLIAVTLILERLALRGQNR